ncbi:MAG TPA: putative zinc-binding peptidase [Roseiarcus sp.]
MKLFKCQACGQVLLFENTRCEKCARRLGYLPQANLLTVVEPSGQDWTPYGNGERAYRFCLNADYDCCNWLIPADSPDRACAACRHNGTVPDLSQERNVRLWRKIELAKHRLIYSLLRLELPLRTRAEDPEGLIFEFLDDHGVAIGAKVLTGHDSGRITIALAEADDAERENRRSAMGEPYRTLLGHFRHEIGHYYWDRLVRDSAALAACRDMFGDDRRDYDEALRAHYQYGAPANWQESFVSAYATCHPWEDFAETWAHYFHMVDTLETANAFGLIVTPKASQGIAARFDFNPLGSDMNRLIEAWLPLTFAVNSINRSMGLHDLYPFVLSPPAIAKLAFVHDRIRAQAGRSSAPDGGLHAMIAGLRQRAWLKR